QIVTAVGDIGNCYFELGDFNKALQYYKYALNFRLSFLPKHHPNVITNYISIGKCYFEIEKLDSALFYYLKAAEDIDDTFGSISAADAYYRYLVGKTFFKMQKIDDALFWYEEALHLLDKMNVENQPINIALENCIGYCNLKAGNTMGAETDFSTALASNRYSEVSDVDSVILLSEFISSKVGLIKVNYQKYL